MENSEKSTTPTKPDAVKYQRVIRYSGTAERGFSQGLWSGAGEGGRSKKGVHNREARHARQGRVFRDATLGKAVERHHLTPTNQREQNLRPTVRTSADRKKLGN